MSEYDVAIELARKAQTLAERLGEAGASSDALITEACSSANLGREWETPLNRALNIALEAGLEEQVGRAYTNLYETNFGQLRLDAAEPYYLAGLSYCVEHDISTYATCLRGGRARSLEQMGRWDEAIELCTQLLARPGSSPINRLSSLISLGKIRARRGGDDPWLPLDEAAASADGADDPQWMGLARLARTEAAWTEGLLDVAVREVMLAAEAAARCDNWIRGAVAVWLRRLGLAVPFGEALPEPYATQLAEDWRAAATMWTELGCRYEAALSLADSTDETALREALRDLDELGATATARLIRARMRHLGLKAVPAGPQTWTRSHQFGLTRRQQEILDLLCASMTNAEISQRLFISEKTVDHHVSAVLNKMGVRSRGAAARVAVRLGLVTAEPRRAG